MVKRANEFPEFEVEALRDKRVKDGVALYLVKWKDYSDSDNTWEPISHLEGSMDLVRDYEERRGRRLKVAKKCSLQLAQKQRRDEEVKAAPLFSVENWHISQDQCKALTVPGCFRKHSVRRVLRIVRDKAGKLQFEVEWKPKGDVKVGNSVVSLEEFTENEPKTLIEFLAGLV